MSKSKKKLSLQWQHIRPTPTNQMINQQPSLPWDSIEILSVSITKNQVKYIRNNHCIKSTSWCTEKYFMKIFNAEIDLWTCVCWFCCNSSFDVYMPFARCYWQSINGYFIYFFKLIFVATVGVICIFFLPEKKPWILKARNEFHR